MCGKKEGWLVEAGRVPGVLNVSILPFHNHVVCAVKSLCWRQQASLYASFPLKSLNDGPHVFKKTFARSTLTHSSANLQATLVWHSVLCFLRCPVLSYILMWNEHR